LRSRSQAKVIDRSLPADSADRQAVVAYAARVLPNLEEAIAREPRTAQQIDPLAEPDPVGLFIKPLGKL
jgi:hypothetical protein